MANEKINFKRKIKWNILFFLCFEYFYEQILNAIGLFKKMKKEKKKAQGYPVVALKKIWWSNHNISSCWNTKNNWKKWECIT